MKIIIKESHAGILRRYERIKEMFHDYLLVHNITPFDSFEGFFQSLCWDIAVDLVDRTKMDQDSYVTLRNQIIRFIKTHFYSEYKEWWENKKNSVNEDNSYKGETITESEVYKNIESLIKHWKNRLKKGEQIRFEKDDLEFWGINKNHDIRRTQILFQELVGDEDFAKKVIKNLMNKKFSTKDFDSRIVGGYDFEWTITHMEYRDYDFFLYGKTLPGGTVSMMDDRNLTLVEALEDSDIAYEIQDEVNDVVQDCMNSIILPITGYEVEVPMILIDEK